MGARHRAAPSSLPIFPSRSASVPPCAQSVDVKIGRLEGTWHIITNHMGPAALLLWALFTAWTVYSFANGAAESIP